MSKLERISGPKKYALVKLRKWKPTEPVDHEGKKCFMIPIECVDFGDTQDTDFFAIRVRDKYAPAAFGAYGMAALQDGQPEYGLDVLNLAHRSANHPRSKRPD